mgnify:CR=1 FL=1
MLRVPMKEPSIKVTINVEHFNGKTSLREKNERNRSVIFYAKRSVLEC